MENTTVQEWTFQERQSELAVLHPRLEAAYGGDGSVVTIEGPPGIGKSRLLTEVTGLARHLGMRVIRATAAELEREISFGVVRQLFDPLLRSLEGGERHEVFAGAARLAEPLFSDEGWRSSPSLDPSPIWHGLYWMVSNLVKHRALVAAVDDVHWADAASVGWLSYLARRLDGMPALVLLTTRVVTANDSLDIAGLSTAPLATTLTLGPLSPEAVALLIGELFSGPPDREFTLRCQQLTKGNPFLLRELLTSLRLQGIEPTKTSARLLQSIPPRSVARSVFQRLRLLPDAAIAIAGSIAVLGDGTDLTMAAALTGLEVSKASQAVDALVGAYILDSTDVMTFVHPLVRFALYSDIPAGRRSRMHAAAARMLSERGADPEAIASHLLATDPTGDGWVVEQLCRAADRASGRGATSTVVSYLRRALREPPSLEGRRQLLLRLGVAECRTDPTEAVDHLTQALHLAQDGEQQAEATLSLALALIHTQQLERAVEVLQGALAGSFIEDRELRLRIEAQLLFTAAELPLTTALAFEHLARQSTDLPGSTRGERLMLCCLARRALYEGDTPALATLTKRALEDGRLLDEEGVESPLHFLALICLMSLDDFQAVDNHCGAALAVARAQGSALGFAMISVARADSRFRQGALADAEADARAALDAMADPSWVLNPMAVAILADALTERGDLNQAKQVVEEAHLGGDLPETSVYNLALERRGRVHFAAGEYEAALSDFLECGRRIDALRMFSPAISSWRSGAARSHLALGHCAEARALADKELALARQVGTPRALGVALLAAGLAQNAGGIDLLAQAASILAPTGARLEYARSLIELGGMLRRANRRVEASERLRNGLDVAFRCGGHHLVRLAREELAAAGARPRRMVLRGVDALTPSETRVAEMASGGLTNAEIAQALFVTENTVETHLKHAFAKLEIRGRRELASLFAKG